MMDINQQTRDEVYRVIDAERQRQEDKWGIKYNTPAEWILILEQKILEAKQAWYFNHQGRESCVSLINQIAAVAVAALEQHGTEFDLIRQYSDDEVIPKMYSRFPTEEEKHTMLLLEDADVVKGVGEVAERIKALYNIAQQHNGE